MNILIVRVSAIGDVIHTIPAVMLLKKLNPQVNISWIVQKKASSLLVGQSFIKNLYELPDNFLRFRQLSQTKAIIEQLRQTKWDAIIDFQGLEKSSLLYASLGGKRYGFTKEHARSKISTLFTQKRSHAVYTNIIQKNLDLASYVASDLFGSTTCPVVEQLSTESALSVKAADQEIVDSWLAEQGIENYLLLAPNTTWESKHWPQDYWFDLMKSLSNDESIQAFGIKLVLVGSQLGGMAERLAHALRKEQLSVQLLPTFNLLAMARLIRKSKLIVAPDTGLLHLADLVGALSIGIFCPTNARRHGPYLVHQNVKHVIQISCEHHYQKSHGTERDCMRAFTPSRMYEQIMQALTYVPKNARGTFIQPDNE